MLQYVTWKGGDSKDESSSEKSKFRSKALINIMKARLQYACPEKCGMIIRNEAHVRLMSSLWYMLLALQIVALLGALLSLVSVFRISVNEIWWKNHSTPFIFSLAMVFFAFFSRYTIEYFLHYQRCREIVFVLGTFHFASIEGVVINSDAKTISLKKLKEDLYQKRNEAHEKH